MNSGEMSQDDARELRLLLSYATGIDLHIGMFIPSLLSQASEEQQAYWLPKVSPALWISIADGCCMCCTHGHLYAHTRHLGG